MKSTKPAPSKVAAKAAAKPQPLAVIVLAAGKGTRMRSELPKVLHPIAGKPMLWHVLTAAQQLSPTHTVVVTGYGAESVEGMVTGNFSNVTFARQTEQKGTGHATLQAQAALKGFIGNVVVLYGDVMLNARHDVLPALAVAMRANPAGLTLLTADVADPTGFGRIFKKGAHLINIEEKDCTDAQRKITTANPGIYGLPAAVLWKMLAQLKPNNKQAEYYLTDIIALAPKHKLKVSAVSVAAARPEMGVNTRAELADMEAHIQTALRRAHMLAGVTLRDPQTTYFSADTTLGTDVTIGQNVVFGHGVKIESGAEVLPFCHLEGCTIKSGARVGPFARIRSGTTVKEAAHIGTFVEVKNSTIGSGSKANHLTYVGDADVGDNVNLGAGTITANYNKKTGKKSRTVIESDVSTGAGTVLVAPVKLGKKSATGAATVVRSDVPAGTLAVTLATLKSKSNYNR